MELKFDIVFPNLRTKKRPRSSIVKGKVRVYDSQSNEVRADRCFLMKRMKSLSFCTKLTVPLHLDVVSTLKRPKSRAGEEWAVSTPDLDNVLKYYMDILNGLIYYDDRYVSSFSCSKKYGDMSMVSLKVFSLE